MIGLFDSGLGGLTVVRRVRERLPEADLVFFADQAHVPYGERSLDDLVRLLSINVAWLDAQSPDAIVMACNTSCAIADVYGWPSTRATVFDLIDSAAIACERAVARRIGVIATPATVSTGAYGRRLRSRIPSVRVLEVPAPALVPLVEAGQAQSPATREAVASVCAQLPPDLDAIVYGCTHYPILDAHFAAVLGKGVERIDPALIQAERAADLIEERGRRESGRTRYVTNGDLDAFRANVARIMGTEMPAAERADIALPVTGHKT
ncbi:MAG: glutamate racemase [Vulcanimicrobiaceae bacterium]